jgi:HK97 family phage prohead protease
MREEVNVALEIKQITDAGEIEGYAATYDIDLGLDRIEQGAFGTLKKKSRIPMLWQHANDEPIGVWTDFKEDRNGLLMKGELNLSRDSGGADVPMAWKARALVKQGAVSGLSIGFFAIDYRYEGDIRVLEKVDVIETSLATFPMNPMAQVVDIKDLMTNKGFEQALRDRLGLSRKAAEAIRLKGQLGVRDLPEARKAGYEPQGSGEAGVAECKQSVQRLIDLMTTR